MNRTDTYSFLVTTMLAGISQTALGNLHEDVQLCDDLSSLTSSVDYTDKWNSFTDYSYNNTPESNSSITLPDAVNVGVLMDFGKTLAGEMTGVDPEIQQIVDDHFWEMLLCLSTIYEFIFQNICLLRITSS